MSLYSFANPKSIRQSAAQRAAAMFPPVVPTRGAHGTSSLGANPPPMKAQAPLPAIPPTVGGGPSMNLDSSGVNNTQAGGARGAAPVGGNVGFGGGLPARALPRPTTAAGQLMGGQAAVPDRLQGDVSPPPPPNSVQGIPPPTSPTVSPTPVAGVAVNTTNNGNLTDASRLLDLTPEQRRQRQIDDYINSLLGGPRDTSAEEAQIQQQLLGTVGAGQADLNARMGASGFGTSGALGAMSGDMRRRAAEAAAQQVTGLRQGARDEQLARGNAAFGMDATQQDQAMQQFINQESIKALQAYLGLNEPSPPPPPPTSLPGDTLPGATQAAGDTAQGILDTVGKFLGTGSPVSTVEMKDVPKGAHDFTPPVDLAAYLGRAYLMYQGPDGHIYLVKR